MTTSTHSYFANGGLRQVRYTHAGGAPSNGGTGTQVSRYAWTYDVAGRVSTATSTRGASTTGTVTYGYDNTHQLTSAVSTVAGATAESFTFDATGNRTGGGISVDRNRVTSDGTYDYEYDFEGNQTKRTKIGGGGYEKYFWDHRQRLVKVEFYFIGTSPYKQVQFFYDAFDRRVMKRVDATGDGTYERVERYVHDGDHVALVLDGESTTGAVKHRFLHGPEIDQIFADESSVNGLMWALTDNQGTVRDMVNSSGTVVNHLRYSAFGRIEGETDSSKTPYFAYTAREWDEDVGLYYYRRRWTRADGRFLSPDPLGLGPDTNPYRYTGNSPTNGTDPSGLQGGPPGRMAKRRSISYESPTAAFIDSLAGQFVNGASKAYSGTVDRASNYMLTVGMFGEAGRDAVRDENARWMYGQMQGFFDTINDMSRTEQELAGPHRDPNALHRTQAFARQMLPIERVAEDFVGVDFHTGDPLDPWRRASQASLDTGLGLLAISGYGETRRAFVGSTRSVRVQCAPRSGLRQTGAGFFRRSADEAYDAIRASTSDVASIAQNTGIKPGNIQKVKDHLFHQEHLLDRYVDLGVPAEMRRFDSDLGIANAWKRLEDGAFSPADLQLLRHEAAEAHLMRRWADPSYTRAHNRAQRRFPAPRLD